MVWHLTTETWEENQSQFMKLQKKRNWPLLPKLFKIIEANTSKTQPFYPMWIFQRAKGSKIAGPSVRVVTSIGKALGRIAQKGNRVKHGAEKSSGRV